LLEAFDDFTDESPLNSVGLYHDVFEGKLRNCNTLHVVDRYDEKNIKCDVTNDSIRGESIRSKHFRWRQCRGTYKCVPWLLRDVVVMNVMSILR
jgi:hypothetical protein